MAQLERQRLEPERRTLEQCTETELDAAEQKWIRYYKVRGEAELNISVGGETRSASKLLNIHPDDWLQFASQVRDAYGLLLDVQEASLQLSSVKNYDAMRKLILKWRRIIEQMEQQVRDKFPEWKHVSAALRAATGMGE